MKKVVTWFSLAVITIFAVYVSFKMADMKPLEGIGDIILKDTVSKTGAMNAVTAVVFDFRGYDTLGESFVLFTAITASAAVLRKPLKIKSNKGGK